MVGYLVLYETKAMPSWSVLDSCHGKSEIWVDFATM